MGKQEILNKFEGTKIYNDVNSLLTNGVAEFDLTDLTFNLYSNLKNELNNIGLSFSEKRKSLYYSRFKLIAQ